MGLLAYLGPETMLPMTSVLAGLAGFAMMFGRKAYEWTFGLFRKKAVVVAPKTRARGHRPTSSRTVSPAGQRQDAESSEFSDLAAK